MVHNANENLTTVILQANVLHLIVTVASKTKRQATAIILNPR